MLTGITIDDIKRALLNGGNVSSLVPILHQLLSEPPVAGVSSLGMPVALPEASILLENTDNHLARLLEAWLQGRGDNRKLLSEVDLTLIALPPYGRYISAYLEKSINEVAPDVVIIGIPPSELSRNMLYAFGMPSAIGLPINGEAVDDEKQQIYHSEIYYPGNLIQTAILKCWTARIPLLPVGMTSKSTRLPSDGTKPKFDMSKEEGKFRLGLAYRMLDDSLKNTADLKASIAVMESINSSFSNRPGRRVSRSQIEEASYMASRIMEAATYMNSVGKKAKFLAIVNLKHYEDTRYHLDLLKKGIIEEVFLPPKADNLIENMSMVSLYPKELEETISQYAPETTPVQENFLKELEKVVNDESGRRLSVAEADKMIADIVRRTREHPGVSRGASVRGAIAFKEVLYGYGEIKNTLSPGSLAKAALVTLPPRMTTRQSDIDSAAAIISDIIKEILYGIRFFRTLEETIAGYKCGQASPQDVMNALENLKPELLSGEQKKQLSEEDKPAIVPDDESDTPRARRGDSGDKRKRKKSLSSEKQAVQHLLQDLEQKFQRVEISEAEYQRARRRLEKMLEAAQTGKTKMSGKDLAETVMELMDAKDKQWGKEVSLERMFVYYHIKQNYKEKELTPGKQSWQGLKILLDDMDQHGILSATSPKDSYKLAGPAMDVLLDYMTVKGRKGRELRGIMDSSQVHSTERKHDVRTFTLGDVFRDISIRHTLREIARQRKKLSDIQRRDFKVFIKQPKRLQSDLVLCVDSSGSMGFHQKLIYARLMAAGLAKSVLEKGGRVGIVTFDDLGRDVMSLTDKKEAVFDYIAAISAGGNTNIGDGIRCATQQLLQENNRNPKFIILVTDGHPTAISKKAMLHLDLTKEDGLAEEDAILETRKALLKGVRTSVIHITDGTESSKGLINNIAKTGSGQVRRISSLDDFKVIMRRN